MLKTRLPIDNLWKRHTGLTIETSQFYTQAARVCLDRHHCSPVDFAIDDDGKQVETFAEWTPTDEHTKRAWANEIDTTENGAYACVLAAIEVCRQMVAVHRAETMTGADYYVAPAGYSGDDLEACFRLEISGTDREPVSGVRRRLKDKAEQADKGHSNLPAIAGVIGFKARLIMLKAVLKHELA